MPIALIIAFAASFGLHAVALFGTDIDLAPEPSPMPLVAELRAPALAAPAPPVVPVEKPEIMPETKPEKSVRGKRPPSAKVTRQARAPVISSTSATEAASPTILPETEPDAASASPESVPVEADRPSVAQGRPQAAPVPVSAAANLPARGAIRFRVDRGDSNFEIGVAHQAWEFSDGRYRLRSLVETTGLVWLLRSVFIEMESLGRYSADGLQPEVFAIRRDARKNRERALFDWETMRIRVADNAERALDQGAQDLLSLYYQLGFLDFSRIGEIALPVATGKKYGMYRLEVLGDEEIELPVGTLRTLHLRAPGENSTEFWLAYDYHLLPVKIRHVDTKGNSLIQVATEIQLGQ